QGGSAWKESSREESGREEGRREKARHENIGSEKIQSGEKEAARSGRRAITVAIDHPDVAGIDRQGQALSNHQCPGALMDDIGKTEQSANQAAIPEGDGNNAVAFLFALQPLD